MEDLHIMKEKQIKDTNMDERYKYISSRMVKS